MTERSIDIIIQNVVASVKFEQTFDLEAIYKRFPDVEYRPNVFPGLVFRIQTPKTTLLIFHSGKMVCTGAKSVEMTRKAVHKVAEMLDEAGIPTGKSEIIIQNIVASVNLGDVTIDLLRLYEDARELQGSIIYEPEQFPGIMFRMKSPKVVFLIFSTGKLVCVGAKQEEEVYKATETLVMLLKNLGVISNLV